MIPSEQRRAVEVAEQVVNLWERMKGIPMVRDRDQFKHGIVALFATAMEENRQKLTAARKVLEEIVMHDAHERRGDFDDTCCCEYGWTGEVHQTRCGIYRRAAAALAPQGAKTEERDGKA